VDSCFVLIGTHQHCVAKICNARSTATRINCKMTPSLCALAVVSILFFGWLHLLKILRWQRLTYAFPCSLCYSFKNFRTVGLLRSDMILPFETPILTVCLLAPRNMWCGNACFAAQASSKYGAWYIERVILQLIHAALAVGLALHIFATQCWRFPIRTKQLSTECCDPALSVLVMFETCFI